MDQTAVLRTTLLALEETIRALASKIDRPSSALVKQINSVLAEINKIVPGSRFATFDESPRPDPVEVLSQIKIGLGIPSLGRTALRRRTIRLRKGSPRRQARRVCQAAR
jgi:hypothetical protein